MINRMPSEATESSDSSPADNLDEGQSRRLLLQTLLSVQSQMQVAVGGLLDCVQAHIRTAEEDEEMEEMDYSEEEDEEMEEIAFRGSLPGRQNVERDWALADELFQSHYFGPNATYNEHHFKRRFGISKQIFSQVVEDFQHTELLSQKFNPVNKKWGITARIKIAAALRMLASGESADRQDEYFQIGETTCQAAMDAFCEELVDHYGPQFLNRSPSFEEKAAILDLMEKRGFPGAFASWDCKHLVWKNCPTGRGGWHMHWKQKKKTLILEAIADPFLYIWFFHFGEPGSMNDLNVLDKSSIVSRILNQSFNTKCPNHRVNNTTRDWLYFLVDGIYPPWGMFVKTIPQHLRTEEKHSKYCTRHEHVRKDVERCFGVLIQRFGILERPFKSWYVGRIQIILKACVILHNMMVEEKKNKWYVCFQRPKKSAYIRTTNRKRQRRRSYGSKVV